MHKERQQREAEMDKKAAADPHATFVEYERKMRAQAEEEEAKKAAKLVKAKERKAQEKESQATAAATGDDDDGGGGDPDMLAMMGFGGFGTSKKA